MNGVPMGFRVVYPQNGHKTYESNTFIMGQVLAQSAKRQLIIQGKLATLSPHGFFSEFVTLKPGENYISIELQTSETSYSESRHITVHWPEKIPGPDLEINETTLSKTGIITLMPGDDFSLAFSATPNSTVWLDIPNVTPSPQQIFPKYPNAQSEKDGYIDNRELIFKELHQAKPKIPKSGWYEITFAIPSNVEVIQNTPINIRLERNGLSKTIILPMTLSIWQKSKLAYVQTLKADGAIIRKSPPEGDRLTPLQPGAILWIDGRDGDWCRVKLSPQDHAWIHFQDIHFAESFSNDTVSIEPPYVLTHDVITDSESITINSHSALPVHIEATPKQVVATLFGGTLAQSVQPDKTDFFRSLNIQQERENVILLQAELSKPCAGFDIFNQPDGKMQLQFKSLPDNVSELAIVLDPGHGGSETGSTGLSNLPEKTLNLAIALMLQKALIASGIPNVLLTRDHDMELPLTSRGAFIREHQPHLTVSLHHNALPDGRDPKKYKGACTFYYHDFSKPLAQHLQTALVRDAQMPDFGVLHESFYITRIPQSISVLVELGFFTNPDEYEKLIDPEHQKKAVAALVTGIHSFFNSSKN